MKRKIISFIDVNHVLFYHTVFAMSIKKRFHFSTSATIRTCQEVSKWCNNKRIQQISSWWSRLVKGLTRRWWWSLWIWFRRRRRTGRKKFRWSRGITWRGWCWGINWFNSWWGKTCWGSQIKRTRRAWWPWWRIWMG